MYTNITVKQLLARKGNDVWSLKPEVTVLEALKFMAEKNIGAVIVIQDEKPVGIFSERDYARKVLLEGKNAEETSLAEVMTSHVIGVEESFEIDACLALMTNKFIRHLPVIDKAQKIIGVISIGDVVKALVEEQKFVIDQLVHYISGEQRKPSIPEPSRVELP
jgi:CBS domain-containing protein